MRQRKQWRAGIVKFAATADVRVAALTRDAATDIVLRLRDAGDVHTEADLGMALYLAEIMANDALKDVNWTNCWPVADWLYQQAMRELLSR